MVEGTADAQTPPTPSCLQSLCGYEAAVLLVLLQPLPRPPACLRPRVLYQRAPCGEQSGVGGGPDENKEQLPTQVHAIWRSSHLCSRGLTARSTCLLATCSVANGTDETVLALQSNEGRVMLRRASSLLLGTPCSSIRALTSLRRVGPGSLPVGTPPKLDERPGTTQAQTQSQVLLTRRQLASDDNRGNNVDTHVNRDSTRHCAGSAGLHPEPAAVFAQAS